jgi:hypothetical protein
VVIAFAIGPTEDDGHLGAIKIRSTPYFRREVKPEFPCRKILWHVKDHYSMKEILVGKFTDISCQVSPASLPGISASYYQRSLISESGTIRAQMGMHSRSVIVAMYGTPCAIPPCKL